MALTLAQKLRIKEGMTLLAVNAPSGFANHITPLPSGVKISSAVKEFQQIHWFVTSKAQLEKEFDKTMNMLKGGATCWIYYPKGTSKIQTDLTRDKGWEKLRTHAGLQWLSLISFDDTWSSFAIRLQAPAELKKEKELSVRSIFNYIDAKTKTVRLPDDLAAALKKNKKASAFFEALSFTNRKEYVEWVITAKREETRKERVNGTIERLGKNWKNPRNM